MGKPSTASGRVVVAISDARRVVYEALARDGIDELDEAALLLLDTAAYEGERADVLKRAGDVLRDTGEVTPWIERQVRYVERDFQHVRELQAA